MLLGGLIAWIIGPVWLLDHGLITESSRRVDILLLVMWPGVGMLIAGGISTLLLRWRVLLRTFESLSKGADLSGDLSLRWVGVGSLIASVVLVLVQRAFFGTPVVAVGPRASCWRSRSDWWRSGCWARRTGARSRPWPT